MSTLLTPRVAAAASAAIGLGLAARMLAKRAAPSYVLHVYDHCPFCVRVRVALGLKGIEHKLVFMGNDDVETPTALVGKKIAPIWVDDDGPMAESLGAASFHSLSIRAK